MRATWFVLEDGNAADPAECADQDGVLTHSSGVKVAMRSPGVPRSRGVDLDESGKQLFGGKGDHDGNGAAGGAKPTDEPKPSTPATTETSAVVTEDMQPAQRPSPARNPGYQTRQGKGRR